jgi:hypothetical protein
MIWIFCHKFFFVDNGFYEFKNVDGSLYVDHINYDKLKKKLDM